MMGSRHSFVLLLQSVFFFVRSKYGGFAYFGSREWWLQVGLFSLVARSLYLLGSSLIHTRSAGVKKGVRYAEEDNKLTFNIKKYGEGGWHSVPQKAGLQRYGKSSRLRSVGKKGECSGCVSLETDLMQSMLNFNRLKLRLSCFLKHFGLGKLLWLLILMPT
ncbi:hypothetical protein V6N11_067175 [Hibiscus sabdariffa]|uniref:Uncharacterized protein n=1 Tax=Hibiscus sabdariffa TaxID=183260 RepID=A0ABR2SQX1_9ROSI